MRIFIAGILLVAILVLFSSLATYVWADISVRQDNLTESEQKTLDEIAQSRADGTYIPPMENISPNAVQFTANVTVYQNEDTVKIPFLYDGRHCVENNDGYVSLYTCIWRGYAPDGSAPVWDIEKEEWTSEIILEQEAKENYVQEQIPVEGKKELTLNESRMQYIENKTTPTAVELEELELRKRLGALCRNDTLVSQEYREFEVPTVIYRDHEGKFTEQLIQDTNPKTPDYRNNSYVKDLKLQVQECIGQPFTKKSAQYDNIIVDGLFSADPNRPQAPDAITADMVNADSNTGFVSDGVSAMCGSHNSERTKLMYGCPQPTPDVGTDKTPEMMDYAESQAYKEWEQYQLDQGVSQKDKIIEQKQTDTYNRYR